MRFRLVLPGLFLVAAAGAWAAPATITFEEPIASTASVVSQYCNDPVTNRGVSFWPPARIFIPAVGTASGSHALSNDFGQEFNEAKRLDISFTTGQTLVSMDVGIPHGTNYDVTAVLTAYTSTTAGVGALSFNAFFLGRGPQPITIPISIASGLGQIRSVRLECTGMDSGQWAIEAIDDLTVSEVGPPCIIDNTAPTIQILKPAADNVTVYTNCDLWFTVRDPESGTAKIEVAFLNAGGTVLQSLSPCGAPGMPACGPTYGTISDHFWTYLPAGTRTIRVRAWDYAGNVSEANRTINLDVVDPQMNLYARGLEITQGTQNWVPLTAKKRQPWFPETFEYPTSPTIPLVANRTTVVRLYAGVEGVHPTVEVENVSAVLRAYTDASFSVPVAAFPSITPVNGTRTIRPTDTFQALRLEQEHSFTFVLPKAWTQAGTIYLEGAVKGPGIPVECLGCEDAANRIRVSKIPFNTVPDFSDQLVHLVAVRHSLLTIAGATIVTDPNPIQIQNATHFIRLTYPVDETTVPSKPHATWTLQDDEATTLGIRCDRVIGMLAAAFPDKGGKKSLAGLVPVVYPCSGRGGGSKENGGYCYARLDDYSTAAHEIGHTVGLAHAGPPPGHGAECPGCDADWPWPHGTIGVVGYNILTLMVIPAETTEAGYHDFMSYGGPNMWVSPRNYIRAYNSFAQTDLPYPKPSALAAAPNPPEASYLMIRGEYTSDTGWTLLPVYEMSLTAGLSNQTGEGPYALELFDASERLIFQRRFAIPEAHVDQGMGMRLDAPPSFAELVPQPQSAATIVFSGPRGIEVSLARTANAPAARIISPTEAGFGGNPRQALIEWDGSDADPRSRLHYMIQYSPNLGRLMRWTTLATDVTGARLEVDADTLAGGASARVRVLATDGFNTTIAESPAFAKADTPPDVTIVFPPPYMPVWVGERVLVRAAASDLEDGQLLDNRLAWDSNVEGPLGAGRTLDVVLHEVGVQEIQVIAADSAGQSNAAIVPVTVMTRVNSQPVANAGNDRRAVIGSAAPLHGLRSFDPDGDPLTFGWRVVSAPPGAQPVLSDAQSPEPILTVGGPGVYRIELVVHDGKVPSFADEVEVSVATGVRTWREY